MALLFVAVPFIALQRLVPLLMLGRLATNVLKAFVCTLAACGMLLLGGGVIRDGGLIDPRFDGTVTLDLVAEAALIFIGAVTLINMAWNLWRTVYQPEPILTATPTLAPAE